RMHFEATGSAVAERLLARWPQACREFTKVMPTDYKRVLEERQGRKEAQAATGTVTASETQTMSTNDAEGVKKTSPQMHANKRKLKLMKKISRCNTRAMGAGQNLAAPWQAIMKWVADNVNHPFLFAFICGRNSLIFRKGQE